MGIYLFYFMDLSELEVRKSDADKNKPFHRFDKKIDPRPGYVPVVMASLLSRVPF